MRDKWIVVPLTKTDNVTDLVEVEGEDAATEVMNQLAERFDDVYAYPLSEWADFLEVRHILNEIEPMEYTPLEIKAD